MHSREGVKCFHGYLSRLGFEVGVVLSVVAAVGALAAARAAAASHAPGAANAVPVPWKEKIKGDAARREATPRKEADVRRDVSETLKAFARGPPSCLF